MLVPARRSRRANRLLGSRRKPARGARRRTSLVAIDAGLVPVDEPTGLSRTGHDQGVTRDQVPGSSPARAAGPTGGAGRAPTAVASRARKAPSSWIVLI